MIVIGASVNLVHSEVILLIVIIREYSTRPGPADPKEGKTKDTVNSVACLPVTTIILLKPRTKIGRNGGNS